MGDLQAQRRAANDNIDFDQVRCALDLVKLDIDFSEITNIEGIRPAISPVTQKQTIYSECYRRTAIEDGHTHS